MIRIVVVVFVIRSSSFVSGPCRPSALEEGDGPNPRLGGKTCRQVRPSRRKVRSTTKTQDDRPLLQAAENFLKNEKPSTEIVLRAIFPEPCLGTFALPKRESCCGHDRTEDATISPLLERK
jgi:hypothetical protein